MITISSNPCGHALGSRLGWGAHNARLKQLGFRGTQLNGVRPLTTPNDVGLYFDKLYKGKLLSQASTKLLLGYLAAQQINNRLPLGLPAGTKIAHKTGDLSGFTHDAGIVYGPKTNYIVVAMSGPWQLPGNSYSLFAQLAAKLNKQFSL